MIIGLPKEIKVQEYRVGLTPEGVHALVANGHKVYVETQAGSGSGFSDESYQKVGATILNTAKEVYEIAEMIVKVSPLTEQEADLLVDNQILFSFLLWFYSKKYVLIVLLMGVL